MRFNTLKASIVAQPARDFAKKTKKAKQNPADATEYETVDEPVQEHVEVEKPKAAPKAAAPKASSGAEPWKTQTVVLDLDKSLFQPFSIGDVKQVDSTPDNNAPSYEDTIEGRYANVLFKTASQKAALYTVYEDMMYLSELYKHSEVFRSFTENGGVGTKEITDLNNVLRNLAPFNDVTLRLLTVLVENKRLVLIEEVAKKYKKLYQQFNKEEKITIISAEELTAVQQSQVVAALKENPQNAGKDFTIEYQVDKSIQGGLQMYTESEFMDMSISSRMLRINEEVAKLVM
jgi:ATP synthase F1 delta subunit